MSEGMGIVDNVLKCMDMLTYYLTSRLSKLRQTTITKEQGSNAYSLPVLYRFK